MRASDIVRLLPRVYQRAVEASPPMAGLIAAMEALHGRCEETLSGLDGVFDPRRCPDAFVPLLARWVGAAPAVGEETGRRRELVAGAVALAERRGTAGQLCALLELATGLRGFAIDQGGAAPATRPFHMVVRAPAAAQVHAERLHALIAAEKPAHLTYQLRFPAPQEESPS
jgi:phage tail-like protein